MVTEIKSEDKDMVDKIIQYESGKMDEEETIFKDNNHMRKGI